MKEKEEKNQKPSILLIFLFSLMALVFIAEAIFGKRECTKFVRNYYCDISKEY
jgi:hypothetical protein